jgi:hypothetical protein
MRYLVLATDYDGTLARQGHVHDAVWQAIRRLRESGRLAILVTGRELEDLEAICPRLDLFERIVAENGALLYNPKTKESRTLCPPPPAEFAAALRAQGVAPLSAGHVIVATVRPHDALVLSTINELGLELQVIFNQESVMVLPTGVNKATGLLAALKELGYSPHNTVGIGDAENDHALLTQCELGAAVGNAVPALKQHADYVCRGSEGSAVIELIDLMINNDLASIGSRVTRHDIVLGTSVDGRQVRLPSYGQNVLIAGPSGSGKSTLATGLIERLTDARFQYAVVDPEGDYKAMPGAVVLGSPGHAPVMEEVESILANGRSAVINLVGLPLGDRPQFFDQLLPRLLELRGRTGQPHWMIIDESHHLMPTDWSPSPDRIPRRLHNLIMLTVHPASVSREILKEANLVLVVGRNPGKTLEEYCTAAQVPAPVVESVTLESFEAVAHWVDGNSPPIKLTTLPPRAEQQRHRRKYAEGRLSADRCFVFRGPSGQLNLRAYNLTTFVELGFGVDDATWLYHLKRGEYSDWLRKEIKDDDLARQVASVELHPDGDAKRSREAVRKAIEERYTLPAEPISGTR